MEKEGKEDRKKDYLGKKKIGRYLEVQKGRKEREWRKMGAKVKGKKDE